VETRIDSSALEFAGFWRRLAAAIIDGIVAGILVSAFTAIFFPYTWMPFFGGDAHWIPFYRGTVQNIISNGTSLVYSVAFWAWRGQTPGKMLLNIKIIRTDGSSLSIGYAVLRYLGYLISGFVFLLGFIWIAFDARKQGWHDKIADTFVVKLPPPTREAIPAAKPSM
jgi:uncharacterized RDD family membrane protein YckC